jgi:hypothetical protein
MVIAETTATIRTEVSNVLVKGNIRPGAEDGSNLTGDANPCCCILLGLGPRSGPKEYCRRFSRFHAKTTITK